MRRQAVACLLLLLIAHALFVHFTHHHAARGTDLTGSAPVASQDTHTPEQHLPHTQGEHCVACHLQRNYLASEHSPVFVLDLAPATPRRQVLAFDPHESGAFLTPAGRAPPLS